MRPMMSSGYGSGGVHAVSRAARRRRRPIEELRRCRRAVGVARPDAGSRLSAAVRDYRVAVDARPVTIPWRSAVSDDARTPFDCGRPEQRLRAWCSCPAAATRSAWRTPVTLPDFWIDRTEVTNQDFKRFVDAGGYRDAQFWKHPFTTANGTLTFEDAMARFRDATGRPGPAAWELGSYPEGRAEYPVGGHQLVRGRGVCRIHRQVAADDLSLASRRGCRRVRTPTFCGSATSMAKAPNQWDERAGLGPWGTLDMAGNVKEWCAERVERARDAALHPRRRVERAGLSLPRPRRGRSVAARSGLRRAAGEEPRTCGDAATRCPAARRSQIARAGRAIAQFEVLKALLCLRPCAARRAKVEAVDDSSPQLPQRDGELCRRIRRRAHSRPISTCRRTRGRRIRRCCTFPTPMPVGRNRAASWIWACSNSSCAAAGRCSTPSTKARSSAVAARR